MPNQKGGSSSQDLKNWLNRAQKIVIAGIGNPIREDDFVGVKIIHELQGKFSENVLLIECETVPENFAQQIIDFAPTHILLIDAAILNLDPGEWKLVEPRAITNFPAFSTHALPLRVFCDYLTAATDASIALLLIQPKITDFGERLSPEITHTAHSIASILLESSLGKKPRKS